jgi:hypothetical protein
MDTGFEGWHLYTACKLTFTHFYQPDDHRFERFGTGFKAVGNRGLCLGCTSRNPESSSGPQ